MTLVLALDRAAHRLAGRLSELEARLDAGDATAWPEYVSAVAAFAAVVAETRPERRGELLTTAQMAARLQIKPQTLLRRAQRGRTAEPMRLGKRGPGSIRWRGTEAGR